MPLKLSILFALVVSLLAAPLAHRVVAQPAPMKMPGCAMMTCVKGCCAVMPCCARSQRENPQPIKAPAPPRTDAQFATLSFHVLSLLYTLPAPPRTFVILDEENTSHTLPPLATNCIQLI